MIRFRAVLLPFPFCGSAKFALHIYACQNLKKIKFQILALSLLQQEGWLPPTKRASAAKIN